MTKQNIAVIFGSRSAEHDVSIITAISSIIESLEVVSRYNVIPIYIDKKGAWYSHSGLKDISLFSSGKLDDFILKLKPISVSFNGSMNIVFQGLKAKKVVIDVAFPATHGTYGEDGSLMGLLEMANVAYVGCDLPSSVIAMDKVLSKIVTTSAKIPSNQFVWFYRDEFLNNKQDVIKKIGSLKFPLFVKPAHLGSSIAISRVSSDKELINAIEVAMFYDNKIIVEEEVANLVEVTVPLMGNDKIVAANTEEPNQGDRFFDFDTKYLNQGKSKVGSSMKGSQGYSHIPARISEEMRRKAVTIAKDAYRAIGCKGIARVDLLIDKKTNDIFFNEVNPLPGSLYAHNWNSVGISKVDLVEKLIDLAKENFKVKQKVHTTFSSKFLQQF
ncbi:MAG TPA: D-alanine--D-alanine ligase [Candidatus Saccharimonadia bacterium]|nr:D-alanine--D-alanine ligase [Candidatus Saccharimonadia bacterium]